MIPFVLRLFLDNVKLDTANARSHEFVFDPWKSNRPWHERCYRCKKCDYWICLSKPSADDELLIRARYWKSSVDEFESCKQVTMKKALD